jgi:hypothetical protein
MRAARSGVSEEPCLVGGGRLDHLEGSTSGIRAYNAGLRIPSGLAPKEIATKASPTARLKK